MKGAPLDRPSARGLRVAVVRSRYHAAVVDGLLAGALEALRRFDAIVALGAVIKGETDHYEHIAREACHGLAAVSRETGVPVGLGVLTVAREEQALARSAPGPDNKGAEAARAAVAMVHILRSLGGRGGAARLRRKAR